MGWCVSKPDGMLVNIMGCYFPGWSGSIRVGMLVNGIEC